MLEPRFRKIRASMKTLTLAEYPKIIGVQYLLILSVPHNLQGRSPPQSALQDHQLTLHCRHVVETLAEGAMMTMIKRRYDNRFI